MILSEESRTVSENLTQKEVTGQHLTRDREDKYKFNGGSNGRYFVNTNGTCFLCLQATFPLSNGFYSNSKRDKYGGNNWREGDEIGNQVGGVKPEPGLFPCPADSQLCAEGREGETGFCHWNIFRYLNITPCSIAKGQRMTSDSSLVASDFSVAICGDCSVVLGKMSRLCEELELLQMRMDTCVQTVQEILTNSENDPVLVTALKDRLDGGTGQGDSAEEGILQRRMVDLLRKETKEKCVSRLRKSQISKARLKPKLENGEGEVKYYHCQENEKNSSLVIADPEVGIPVDVNDKQCDRLKMKMEDDQSNLLIFKEEDKLSLSSPISLSVPDLQTEWTDSVPEVEQDISIGGDDVMTPTDNDLLFDQIPCLPPILEETATEQTILEGGALGSPYSSSMLTSTCSLPFPLPPPPVNLPPKPKRAKNKKKAGNIQDDNHRNLKSTTSEDFSKCPVDFYFHKKQDNRHLCPFCADTSPTLTNLRFHVIRAHPEELFSNCRLTHIPTEDFKASCELTLLSVTKAAETGERNPSGTKVIVKCNFCSPADAKVYHDKRAFQCHLILNHYSMLTQRLLELQNSNKNGEIAASSVALPVVSSPSTQNSPATAKTKRSVVKLKTEKMTPSKKRREFTGGNGRKFNQGSFICEHCGKSLSTSTNKLRHQQLHCEFLKKKRTDSSGTVCSPTPNNTPTSVYLISPQGDIINKSEINTLATTTPMMAGSLTTSAGVITDNSHSFRNERVGLELLLQEANDLIKKKDVDFGGVDSGREEIAEEYEQFVGDFQDFYDEDEVNDALLTMMIENIPGEDPLQI